jgi:hypothetical protein
MALVDAGGVGVESANPTEVELAVDNKRERIMSQSIDGVWRVEKALAAVVGDRAETLMHRRSRHLGA